MALADVLESWKTRWAKALRSCGAPSQPVWGGGRRPRRLFCNLKICPECRVRAQKRNFAKLRPRAVDVLGPTGVSAFITLTAPHDGPLEVRVNKTLDAIRSLLRRQPWKRPKVGLKARVGIVWGFEIRPGMDGKGHPHLHLTVFSRNSADLAEVVELLLDHWQNCFSDARLRPESVKMMSSDPNEWAPRLHYTVEGTSVDTDWPMVVFEVAVMTLTSGRHLYSSIGLMKRKPGAPESGSGPITRVVDSAGNLRKATK